MPSPSSPSSPSSPLPSSDADRPAGHFLNLPGELRNAIYRHYLLCEGGYVYNHDTANLTTTCPEEHLDIALQFTCKQVYKEMYGLPLRINTVHFYPIESEELRVTAARFQSLCSLIDSRLQQMVWPDYLLQGTRDSVVSREQWAEEDEFHRTREHEKAQTISLDDNATGWDGELVDAIRGDPRCRNMYREPELPWAIPPLTQQVIDEVVRTYPEMQHLLLLEPCLHLLPFRRTEPIRFWGTGHMADSRLRKALLHTVQVAVDQGCFGGAIAASARTIIALSSKCQLWDIPSSSLVDEILRSLRECGALNQYDSEMGPWSSDYWSRPGLCPYPADSQDERKNIYGKHRYSAAAAAIQFLKSLPSRLRTHICTIVLHEDQTAVSAPQCHGMGLIPFCRDNPKLKIERRIHLWKNVILLGPNTQWPLAKSMQPYEDIPRPSKAISALERWISEALALEAAGMPRASFSLVLVGDEGPHEYSQLFETLRLDAVQMLAADVSQAENPEPPPSKISWWNQAFYTFDNWPGAVQDIVDGTSIVRCDFPIRPDLYSIEQVIKYFISWHKPCYIPATMKVRRNRGWFDVRQIPDRHTFPGVDKVLRVPLALESWKVLQESNLVPEFFTSGEQLHHDQ